MTSCLFCKIVNKEIPADVVHQNDAVVAFRDIKPVTPTHVLVIPRKHIVGMHDLTRGDAELVGEVFLAARDVAEKLGLHPKGYRVVVNNGADAGQSVFHLHVHVLAGRPMAWPPG
jgi:histidine triad (HIT) family protein